MDYYLDPAAYGEPAGRWMGSGLSALGLGEGDEVEAEVIQAAYEGLVHPETGEQLGRKPMQFKSLEERVAERLKDEPDAPPARVAEIRRELGKSQKQACHYYDVTFSAQKSVSVLYAALRATGREEEAEGVWTAHREGVAAAMTWLEQEAGYARVGYHGRTRDGRSVGEYVAAREWVGARFDHTTSRNGDPQLHSHLAVLNRVQREDTGEWTALDGRSLYRAAASAEAVYHLAMEEQLQRTHNVEFALRPDGKSREIVGIEQGEIDATSSRRAEADEQVQTWASMYERRHGRAPSAYQLAVMYERAVLATREAKQQPESPSVQNSQWATTLEEGAGRTVDEVMSAAVQDEPIRPTSVDELDRPSIIRAAVQDVAGRRTEWRRDELIGALYRQLPGRMDLSVDDVQTVLDGLADEAVSPSAGYGVVQLTAPAIVATPQALLRDADGRSRWEPHRYERYAVAEQIVAEERLYRGVRWDAPHLSVDGPWTGRGRPDEEVDSSTEPDGGWTMDGGRWTSPPSTADEAVPSASPSTDDGSGQSGRTVLDTVDEHIAADGLDEQQAAAVRGVLTSPRSIDVMIGPAGTGKSRALGSLHALWEEHVGGQVLGLATSQRAAGVLEDEGLSALNIAKFLQQYEPGQNETVRRWLSPSTLLVVDESGMSSTDQLDRVRAVANRYGAKVLLVGDHEQLDAVGPGGSLRMLHRRLGGWELEQVHRFAEQWEQDASLRIRGGDETALVEYEQRGRLRGGDRATMVSEAVEDYLADQIAGRRSLLIVRTNEDAAELSEHIRSRRVALGQVDDTRTTRLRDGTHAGAGDLLQLRRNNRFLVGQNGRGWAVNRDTYRVTAVEQDGSITAEQTDTGAVLNLPEWYAAEHTTLSYAATIHAAQGMTVDVGRWIAEQGTSRQQAYPALTRGRDQNVAYVVTHEEPSDDNTYERLDSTPSEILGDIVRTDAAQRAATDVIEDELDQSSSLAMLGVPWQTVIAEQSRDRAADTLLATLGPEQMDALVDEPGAGRLWRACRSAELAGHDLTTALPHVVEQRTLGNVDSVSDVLRWRLRQYVQHHPADQTADTFIGRSLSGDDEVATWTRELAEAMDRRVQVLGERMAEQPPDWAVEHLGPVPDNPVDRETWIRRASTVAAWREFASREEQAAALGPAPSPEMPEMRAAWDRAWYALGRPEDEVDVYRADDAELEAMVARWQRQLAWAPEWIDDPDNPGTPLVVRATQELHRYQSRLTIAEAELAVAEKDDAAALRQHIEHYTGVRDQLAQQVAQLDEIHTAHREWDAHTRDDYELARRARAELERRDNPDVQATDEQQADRDRWTELLAGAGGVELADDVRRSPAARALWARLEEAEDAGHQAETILPDVVQARELATARSHAAALSWRVDRWLEHHADPDRNPTEPAAGPVREPSTEQEAPQSQADQHQSNSEQSPEWQQADPEPSKGEAATEPKPVTTTDTAQPAAGEPETDSPEVTDTQNRELESQDDGEPEQAPEEPTATGSDHEPAKPDADPARKPNSGQGRIPTETDLTVAVSQARAARQRIEQEQSYGRGQVEPPNAEVEQQEEADRHRREAWRTMDERHQAEVESHRDRGYEPEPS